MNNNNYKTTDTALASYLITQGFLLLAIDYSQPRYDFIFKPATKIADYATKYVVGTALVDPATFNRVNRKLLRIVRNQIQWGDE